MLRLLLDENCASRSALAEHLRSAGHEVQTVVAALGGGASDEEIVAYAVREQWIIITKDADDFLAILSGRSDHGGTSFIIYQDPLAALQLLLATPSSMP